MKIESLKRITGAVPLNTALITEINDIKILATKILEKDLFIDINHCEDDIFEAIQNGAYGILTENYPNIIDKEIAWLYVEDMNLAIIKLARFYASNKDFSFIHVNNIQYKLSKCLHVNKKMQVLSQKISSAFLQIKDAQEKSIFFVVENKFINQIDPLVKTAKKETTPQQIIKKGIFYSSFIFNGKYINDIRLSSFFIPSLCSLLEYLNEFNISFYATNFHNFEHFYPQFVDKKLNKKDFGTSDKVLIFEKEFELFLKEIIFLEQNIDHKSILILTTKNREKKFNTKAEILVYNEPIDIKKLENKKFKYVLIYGDIEDFEEILNNTNNKQMTLF